MAFYTHKMTGDEVLALAWSYILLEEGRLNVNEREFMYEICEAMVGSPCAGVGTLRYIYVPGYIQEWKKYSDGEGNPVSVVEAVRDEGERSRIRTALSAIHPSFQVCF